MDRVWWLGVAALLVVIGAAIAYAGGAGEDANPALLWAGLALVLAGLAIPLVSKLTQLGQGSAEEEREEDEPDEEDVEREPGPQQGRARGPAATLPALEGASPTGAPPTYGSTPPARAREQKEKAERVLGEARGASGPGEEDRGRAGRKSGNQNRKKKR